MTDGDSATSQQHHVGEIVRGVEGFDLRTDSGANYPLSALPAGVRVGDRIEITGHEGASFARQTTVFIIESHRLIRRGEP